MNLESSGPPLGLFPEVSFSRSAKMALRPGHLLALLTDGIAESTSPDGRDFGVGGVTEYLRMHHHDSASDLVQGLYREARRVAPNEPQTDDITAVVAKCLPV